MQHLLAYRESVAASATDLDLDALAGPGDFVTNGHQVLPEDRWLIAAYASGLGLTQMRINPPQLREVAPVQIRPLSKALLPPNDPNVCDFRRRPVRIRANQEIQILTTTDATAGPNVEYTLLWFSDGNFSVNTGIGEYIIRATGAATLVAGVWTFVTLTYQDQLPPGQYEIIGAEYFGTTAVAARLVFVGNQIWKPGFMGSADPGNRLWEAFYGPSQGIDGMGMGSYGVFSNIYLPSVECLANAADTVQTFFFRVRKLT